MNLRVKGKLVVGLTGNIASGKSTALAYFAKNGAEVISADVLVHKLYQTADVQKKMKHLFGSTQPEVIAQAIFEKPEARKRVEKILHPLVLKIAAEQIKKSPHRFFVFEVPLLFEVQWNKLTDLNIVVWGGEKNLKARLKERNISAAEYKRRIKAQMPDSQKACLADVLLVNNGTKKDLGLKVKRLCRAFEYIYSLN